MSFQMRLTVLFTALVLVIAGALVAATLSPDPLETAPTPAASGVKAPTHVNGVKANGVKAPATVNGV